MKSSLVPKTATTSTATSSSASPAAANNIDFTKKGTGKSYGLSGFLLKVSA
jgi:hypothetical protein